jgi:predicted transcriptional regulator
MAISDKNTRTLITLPKELKTALEKLAKDDDRSLNNMMVKILSDYVRSLTP